MNFSNPIERNGISEEITRITGANIANYPNYDRVVRVNQGIYDYFALGNYEFEDSNKSDAPIEIINLVDGTSRYALDDLTSELLNFLRVEVTDNDGNVFIIYPEKLSNIGEAYDEYYSDNGIPQVYLKIGKYIDIKPAPNYDKTDGLKIYFDRPASQYTFVSCTISNASPGVVTAVAHGLSNGDAVIPETDGALPTGLTADTVVYYVINKATDTFQVSLTIGGTAVNTSSAGSGNHKFLKVSGSPGIPSIHHTYLARHASLPFLVEKKLPQMGNIAQLLQADEKAIKKFFGMRNKDEWNGMTMQPINFR